MEYNPLTRRYWLSDDTSVNYLLACRRPGLMARFRPSACCSTWTARWSTARPTWPAPPTTCGPRAWAAAAALRGMRRMVGSGARGMVARAFGVAPGDRLRALRDEFLARYEQRMLQQHAVFDEVPPVLDALDAAAALGHRHQQGDALRRAAGATAWACAARARCWSAATPRRTPSRTRRRC
jgi:hypothetical protein